MWTHVMCYIGVPAVTCGGMQALELSLSRSLAVPQGPATLQSLLYCLVQPPNARPSRTAACTQC